MAKLQQVGTTRPKARRPPGARRSANDQLRQELTDALQRHAAIAGELERVQAALKGSLEQQTATSEILKVIANSQSDVQPVFDAIASSAKKRCVPVRNRTFERAGPRADFVKSWVG